MSKTGFEDFGSGIDIYIDATRDSQTEDLLASPQGFRLQKQKAKAGAYWHGWTERWQVTLTRIRQQPNSMAHHAHLMQRRLLIEQDKALVGVSNDIRLTNTDDLLSISQVALDYPPILQKSVYPFVVLKIDPFTCISYYISGSWVRCGSISHKLCDVERGN